MTEYQIPVTKTVSAVVTIEAATYEQAASWAVEHAPSVSSLAQSNWSVGDAA